MIGQETLLVTLVETVHPAAPRRPPVKRGRGRPVTYPDRVFAKALAILFVRHLHSP